MIYYYKGTSQALSKYRNAFKNIFTDELKDGETLYTDTIKQCKIG